MRFVKSRGSADRRTSGLASRDSLPFSAVSRCLGRDFRAVALRFSTHMRNIGNLGRDFRQATLGFSTFFPVSRYLGRDFPKAAPGISTFSADFRCLGRDFPKAASGISTFSAVSRCLGRDSQADSPPRGSRARIFPRR